MNETETPIEQTAARELEELDKALSALGTPGEKPPKEPRPRIKADQIASVEDIATAFKNLSDYLAESLGEHWRATEGETMRVGASFALLFDRLGPEVWNSTVAAAIIAASSIVFYALPRIILQRKLEAQKQEAQTEG